jgi:hypothetical protein
MLASKKKIKFERKKVMMYADGGYLMTFFLSGDVLKNS